MLISKMVMMKFTNQSELLNVRKIMMEGMRLLGGWKKNVFEAKKHSGKGGKGGKKGKRY